MKKAVLALALAGLLSLGAFAVGCDSGSTGGNTGGTNVEQDKDSDPNNDQGGEQDKDKEEQPAERKLRVLEKDFKYTVTTEEFPVKYGDIEIFGQLWEPKEKGKYPLVILSHGFNGHYTDFPTECRRLAERGYVAYAFDFCGAQQGGKSTGRTADTYTPLTMKEDLINIVQTLTKRLSEVDSTQVFLFGGSQGGFVTALAAADDRVKDLVSAIALYFPAFNIPDDWHGKPEKKTDLMGYYIGADFIKSVQDLDPYALIGNFKKDVCIVWGDQDALVAKKYIDKAMETYGDKAELTVIPGAGHGFGGAALTTAVDTVLAFLEARTYETV